ncbi:MAG: LuxR C-terminal-related transcriptional regulator [Actinomycetota bacterium]
MKQVRVLVVGERPLIVQGLALLLTEDERFSVSTSRRYSSRDDDVDVVVVDVHDGDDDRIQRALVGQEYPRVVLVLAGPVVEGPAQPRRASAGIVSSSAAAEVLCEAVARASSGNVAVAPSPPDGSDDRTPLDRLTPRELEVLTLLGRGLSGEAVALRLDISHNTVRTHVRNACATLGVKSRRDSLEMVAGRQADLAGTEARYERPAFGRSGLRRVELIARQGLRRDGLEASLRASAGLVLTVVHDDMRAFFASWSPRDVDAVILDAESDGALDEDVRSSRRRDLPAFLVLGDRTDREVIVRAFLRGADGFLPLAESTKELTGAIHSVSSGHGYLPRGMLGRLIRDLNAHWASEIGQASALANLTNRERSVMGLWEQGMREKEIAAALFVSPSTVRSHIQRAKRKLGRRGPPPN